METDAFRKHNIEHEQQAINNLAVKWLSKANKFISSRNAVLFVDNATDAIKQGNSNVSYEELDIISRINDDEALTIHQVMQTVNCSFRYFRAQFMKRIRKIKRKGEYSKVDTYIEVEKHKIKNRHINIPKQHKL